MSVESELTKLSYRIPPEVYPIEPGKVPVLPDIDSPSLLMVKIGLTTETFLPVYHEPDIGERAERSPVKKQIVYIDVDVSESVNKLSDSGVEVPEWIYGDRTGNLDENSKYLYSLLNWQEFLFGIHSHKYYNDALGYYLRVSVSDRNEGISQLLGAEKVGSGENGDEFITSMVNKIKNAPDYDYSRDKYPKFEELNKVYSLLIAGAYSERGSDNYEYCKEELKKINSRSSDSIFTLALMRLAEYSTQIEEAPPEQKKELALRLYRETEFIKDCNVRVRKESAGKHEDFNIGALDHLISVMTDFSFRELFPRSMEIFESAEQNLENIRYDKRSRLHRYSRSVIISNTTNILNHILSSRDNSVQPFGPRSERQDYLSISPLGIVSLEELFETGNIPINLIELLQEHFEVEPLHDSATEYLDTNPGITDFYYMMKELESVGIVPSRKSVSSSMYRYLGQQDEYKHLKGLDRYQVFEDSLIYASDEDLEDITENVNQFHSNRYDLNRVRLFFPSVEHVRDFAQKFIPQFGDIVDGIQLDEMYMREHIFSEEGLIESKKLEVLHQNFESIFEDGEAIEENRVRKLHLHFTIHLGGTGGKSEMKFEIQIALDQDRDSIQASDAKYHAY